VEEAEQSMESVVAETSEEYDFLEVERQLEAEMQEAAEALEFERAAMLRDQIIKLRQEQGKAVGKSPAKSSQKKKNARRNGPQNIFSKDSPFFL
jgi:excinuclease ABC subunit B